MQNHVHHAVGLIATAALHIKLKFIYRRKGFPAALKLRPNGAIEIRLLLLLTYRRHCTINIYATQHNNLCIFVTHIFILYEQLTFRTDQRENARLLQHQTPQH